MWCRKGGNNNVYAIDEDYSDNVAAATDNEEDLQAWCLLEEVISRRDEQKVKRANQASLLSVENSHNSNPKKIIEVKGQMGESHSPQMDSGAAGHVMLVAMFPRVKLERKTLPKKFVAASDGKDQRPWRKEHTFQDK